MPSETIHHHAQLSQLLPIRHLLDQDPSLALSLDEDKRTPLHYAASKGDGLAIIQDLSDAVEKVKAGEKDALKDWVNGRDSVGWTAVHCAASAGCSENLNELLGLGGDTNLVTDNGQTALHYAASKGHVQVGRTLVNQGADINAKDRANQLPLHRAASCGRTTFVLFLLSPTDPSSSSLSSSKLPPKTKLNQTDRGGNTPLHLAIESGHAEIAVGLIEAGANRGKVNSDGQCPEEIEGVGGSEARKVREYIASRCGEF